MRKLVNQADIQRVTIDSKQQLDDPSMVKTLCNLRYLLVVGPCRGRTS